MRTNSTTYSIFAGNTKIDKANTPKQAQSRAALYLSKNPTVSLSIREHKVTKVTKTMFRVKIQPIGRMSIVA
jgi:hypothetical protein